MGKCIKSIVLSVMAAVFGVLALSGPVFATPDNANDNTDSSVVTDNNNDANSTDSNETPTENTDNTDNNDDTDDDSESSTSCYDQVGSLGWIICPGAGLFGNIIDGAYNILTNLIQTDPLPTEQDSPIYITWDYFKNFTNSLFIIFFLVVIFSQISGVGINNYGIKKTLPRIILTAIFVNLSYILCVLAVDISNILGNSLYGLFEGIQTTAIESGVISDTASSASVSAIIASVLGIGATGVAFAAAVTLGSFEGIIWFLLPILISGVIAIASAVITMAARQALIFILVIIAPLAIILYMLPNTDKIAKKWFKTFFQMLIFYPAFSVLYGASQLAGLVIISSADNWLTVILGVAVKILPLFMSIPLMRMSGSVLGKIDGIVHRAASPAQRMAGGYAAARRVEAKQKQLNKRNPVLPSTRLAQYLDRRRTQHEFDTAEMAASNKDRNITRAMAGWYNRDGTLNARGKRHAMNEQLKSAYANKRTSIATDFDEGFGDDGNDSRIRSKDLADIKKLNKDIQKDIIENAAVSARKQVVEHNNAKSRAELIHSNISDKNSEVHKRVLDAFNVDRVAFANVQAKDAAYKDAVAKQRSGNQLSAAEQAALNAGPLTREEKALFDLGSQARNYTLANAIATRRKNNAEETSIFYELYDDSPAGPIPGNALTESFESGNYNSMNAAIKVMAKRGDHKDIMDILRKNSDKLLEADPRNNPDQNKIRFQKELNDALIALKPDNQILWAYAKSNMIRRGKFNGALANGNNPTLDAFVDFKTFTNGSLTANDQVFVKNADGSFALDQEGNRIFINSDAQDNYGMIHMEDILTNVKDGKIFAGADRTMFNYFVKAAKDGEVNSNDYIFTDIKHLRASATSGMMDGEQLASFNKYITFGYDERYAVDDNVNRFFNDNQEQFKKLAKKYFADMTAGQIATTKTATLQKFNNALIALGDRKLDLAGEGKEELMISETIYNALKDEINNNLMKPNMTQARASMNKSVRQMLGIPIKAPNQPNHPNPQNQQNP
ncbi:MFS transporter [Candidatus Saccharibacteria bacterium]|nr:MFS transporter [Candidatus Saccharibacteria bacterium]